MSECIMIKEEDPNAPDAVRLMDELSGELEAITGNSGRSSFNSDDVIGLRALFAIARDQKGNAIGCGAIRPMNENIAEVKRMYAKVKGMGVGKQILFYLETRAKELGYSVLRLETRLVNQGAVAFYENNGFYRIPNYGKYVDRPEAACFEKQLMKEKIEIKTERLMISDHDIRDIEPLHRLLSDPVAMYYLQDIKTSTLEESRQNLNVAIKEIGSHNREKYYFKIQNIDSREYIGEVGFTVRLDTPHGKVVNLGYFILPEFWGKGIMTEAVRGVMRFAFEELNVIKIETGCIKENRASEKVMVKIGMIKEADYRRYVWHDNKLKDRVEYRLLKEEWKTLMEAENT